MPNRCPHRGVKLSIGSVRNDRIVCKYHGFEFESNGRCTLIPCDLRSDNISRALSINTFRVREENDLIWLWWGQSGQERHEIPWIEGVPRKAGLAHMSIEWPQHYVRSIETNFDGSHFFFVHRAFLPGIGSHISQIKTKDNKEGFSCTMEVENLKTKRSMQFNTEFLAPNISTIGFANFYGGLIIDTPIDDQRTWRYMRVSKFPFDIHIISSVLGRAAIFLDWLLTQKMQDQPIITTMEPRLPVENSHHFVRADLGMAKYIIMRRHLINQAVSNKLIFPQHVQHELNKNSIVSAIV